MYRVRTKPAHPTGRYYRAGYEFSRQWQEFEVLPRGLSDSAWLDIENVEPVPIEADVAQKTVEPPKEEPPRTIVEKVDLSGLKRHELLALLASKGLELPKGTGKRGSVTNADLIEALK